MKPLLRQLPWPTEVEMTLTYVYLCDFPFGVFVRAGKKADGT